MYDHVYGDYEPDSNNVELALPPQGLCILYERYGRQADIWLFMHPRFIQLERVVASQPRCVQGRVEVDGCGNCCTDLGQGS